MHGNATRWLIDPIKIYCNYSALFNVYTYRNAPLRLSVKIVILIVGTSLSLLPADHTSALNMTFPPVWYYVYVLRKTIKMLTQLVFCVKHTIIFYKTHTKTL